MGIYVRLDGIRVPLRDAPLLRLHYATELIRFFYKGRVFIPETIEIWRGSPSESLGGKRKEKFPKRTEKISDPLRELAVLRKFLSNRKYPLDELLSSVIVVNGVWDFDGLRLAGFLSINNNYSWRRVYRDVEMDAYGRGDIQDLVDALWKMNNIQSMIDKLIERIDLVAEKQPVKPREIDFTIGVPVKGEPENLMAIHYLYDRDLIEFYYYTLKKVGEEGILEKMRPLDRAFFISAISEHKVAQRRLREGLAETYIEEIRGNSVTYVAKERNSFTKLYDKLYATVFKPAMKDLPKANEVKLRISKGLENLPDVGEMLERTD